MGYCPKCQPDGDTSLRCVRLKFGLVSYELIVILKSKLPVNSWHIGTNITLLFITVHLPAIATESESVFTSCQKAALVAVCHLSGSPPFPSIYLLFPGFFPRSQPLTPPSFLRIWDSHLASLNIFLMWYYDTLSEAIHSLSPPLMWTQAE